MPYPVPFLKVVASGTTYPGEIWSCSWNIAQNFSGAPTQPVDLEPYEDAVVIYMSDPDARWTGPTKLTMIKANMVGPDGKYVSEDETTFREVLPQIGTPNPTNFVDPQQTVCVTLRTNKGRGLASAGRFYPPLTDAVLGADGLISTAHAQGMAEAAGRFINALNAIDVGDVAIMSNVREGAFEIVRSVEVGRVIDTQRRRRNALDEKYVQNATALVGVTSP